MDKLKQRFSNVVLYKKNIEVLDTKVKVLVDEKAEVQRLLYNREQESAVEDKVQAVQKWVLEASEILKKASGMSGKKSRLCGTCWDPTYLLEVGEIQMCMDKIFKEREGLDLSPYTFGISYCRNLESREKMLHEISEALTDTHVKVIGVYGMVGVGKTILIEELARRAQTTQLFDAIVMVQVSSFSDVKHIQTQVANKIDLHLSKDDDEETRAQLLHDALKEKATGSKILVILDGIQCVIDLGKVGIPYGPEHEGASCGVVLISRNVDVCKKMGAEKQFLVECLTLKEAMILFREILKEKEIAEERYQNMENVFFIKCRGLPLVINSLARSLRSVSRSKWETIADEIESHALIEVKEVIFRLCNKFIKNQQKRKLFLLCCLIQKGADIPMEKLLRYGIGFGLFETDLSEVGSFSSVVSQTHSWVDELKSLSLLMEGKKPQHVKVHDIIQDVAISTLSQGEYILPVLLDDLTCWDRESYEKCAAISVTPDSSWKCLSGLELYKLQVLLVKGTYSILEDSQTYFSLAHSSNFSLPDNFFQRMQNLRILEISKMEIKDFPSSIGDLKNLVTLHLEYCRIRCALKSMISNVASALEVFSLRGSNVRGLPKEIGKLRKLRVLDLTDCGVWSFDVDGLAKLSQLRELYLYCDYNEWSTSDINKMASLSLEVLEIDISRITRVFSSVVKFPNLLGSYKIRFNGDELTSFSHILLINGLDDKWIEECSSGNIEFLQIKNLKGNNLLPARLQSGLYRKTPCFGNLKHMTISHCGNLKSLFPPSTLDTLSNLEKLQVFECRAMEEILTSTRCADDTNPTNGLTFLKLQTLALKEMYNLRCFYQGHLLLKFPVLREIKLEGLWEIEEFILPDTQSQQTKGPSTLFDDKIDLPSLRLLHVKDLRNVVKVWDVQLLDLQPGASNKAPSFGNLKHVIITECIKLKSLYSSSTVVSLLHLEKLTLIKCYGMEEVFSTTHDEDSTNEIAFPKLHTLELTDLPWLECFYRGRRLLRFPMLRELHLQFRKMKSFTLPHDQSLQTEDSTILFDGKIEIPSLEKLSVISMEIELIQPHGETIVFPNLSCLKLRHLPNLKALPNINLKKLKFLDLVRINILASNRPIFEQPHTTFMSFIMSLELEALRLTLPGEVEYLFYDKLSVDDPSRSDVNLFFTLRKLKLNYIEVKSIEWKRLTNLRSLTIWRSFENCTHVISSSLLLGGAVLPLLESLKVEDCRRLKSIISQEAAEDADVVKYGVTLFPSLRSIRLLYLPNLNRFSMGSYEAHFPSLETLEIVGCPSSFSFGPSRTPKLNNSWNVNEKT